METTVVFPNLGPDAGEDEVPTIVFLWLIDSEATSGVTEPIKFSTEGPENSGADVVEMTVC